MTINHIKSYKKRPPYEFFRPQCAMRSKLETI